MESTPGPVRVLLVYPNIPMMLVPPLSIATFTWILRQEGAAVELFDTTQYWEGDSSSPQNRAIFLQARDMFSEKNLQLRNIAEMEPDFLKELRRFRPQLILFSFTEDALSRALQLLRVSNRLAIPTLVGGVLATAAPEWLLSFPEIQCVAIGEGEEIVREAVQRVGRNESLLTIRGLMSKSDDGTLLRNPPMPYVRLDDYSTDFSLFDEARFERPMGGKIHRAVPIETYRGCPNSCTYCNSPMHNRIAKSHGMVFLRRRSTSWIRREVARLTREHEANLLYFIDDSFLARPQREIDAFIEMYAEFKVPFWFNTRPEDCSLGTLKRLKDVGLFRVSFGIESGNEEFRKRHLNRRITNDRLRACFDIINASGIPYSINYIIGFPHETRHEVFDTIRLAKSIPGYDALTVSIFTPYHGTDLREKAIAAGWLDPNRLTTHTTATSMLTMPQLSAREIDGLMRTFTLYVGFDESEWPEIEKIERFAPNSDALYAKYAERYRLRQWKA